MIYQEPQNFLNDVEFSGKIAENGKKMYENYWKYYSQNIHKTETFTSYSILKTEDLIIKEQTRLKKAKNQKMFNLCLAGYFLIVMDTGRTNYLIYWHWVSIVSAVVMTYFFWKKWKNEIQ